jgi:hypothetical protein
VVFVTPRSRIATLSLEVDTLTANKGHERQALLKVCHPPLSHTCQLYSRHSCSNQMLQQMQQPHLMGVGRAAAAALSTIHVESGREELAGAHNRCSHTGGVSHCLGCHLYIRLYSRDGAACCIAAGLHRLRVCLRRLSDRLRLWRGSSRMCRCVDVPGSMIAILPIVHQVLSSWTTLVEH